MSDTSVTLPQSAISSVGFLPVGLWGVTYGEGSDAQVS